MQPKAANQGNGHFTPGVGEPWRYTTIKQGMRRIMRPLGLLQAGDYVICDFGTHHQPARIAEIHGQKGESLMICTDLSKNPCDMKNCDSACKKRLWTGADHNGVIGEREIRTVFEDCQSEVLGENNCALVDPQTAIVMLAMIQELKARQMR